MNVIHEILYFYSSLRNTCVFDTFPLSALDMRGYFDVFIELIVKVTGVVFEDTLKVIPLFHWNADLENSLESRSRTNCLFYLSPILHKVKLELLILTIRSYFSINWNVNFPLSAGCSSPIMSTDVTSSDQGKVDDKDRVPGEEGTHPCLSNCSTWEVGCTGKGDKWNKSEMFSKLMGREEKWKTTQGGDCLHMVYNI